MIDGQLAAVWFYVSLVGTILGGAIGGEHARKKAKEKESIRFRLAHLQTKEDKVKEEVHKKI